MSDFEIQLEHVFNFKPAKSALSCKKVVITGATSGIGLSLACQLAKRGASLFLIARRSERLDSVKRYLESHVQELWVETCCADITDANIVNLVPKDCEILINNAGLALGRDPGHLAHWSDWDRMLQTNVTALARITHAILPGMVSRRSGHVVSIGSVAGQTTYPGGSIYCATKHAVRAFHEALRQDLCGYNIRLSVISPGMVETEFSIVRANGDKNAAAEVYRGMRPLTGDEVAAEIIHVLETPENLNVDNLFLMPTAQGAATVVARA